MQLARGFKTVEFQVKFRVTLRAIHRCETRLSIAHRVPVLKDFLAKNHRVAVLTFWLGLEFGLGSVLVYRVRFGVTVSCWNWKVDLTKFQTQLAHTNKLLAICIWSPQPFSLTFTQILTYLVAALMLQSIYELSDKVFRCNRSPPYDSRQCHAISHKDHNIIIKLIHTIAHTPLKLWPNGAIHKETNNVQPIISSSTWFSLRSQSSVMKPSKILHFFAGQMHFLMSKQQRSSVQNWPTNLN